MPLHFTKNLPRAFTFQITERQANWIDGQPRNVQISAILRRLLDEHIDKAKGGE